jgi:hypothetical protein
MFVIRDVSIGGRILARFPFSIFNSPFSIFCRVVSISLLLQKIENGDMMPRLSGQT